MSDDCTSEFLIARMESGHTVRFTGTNHNANLARKHGKQ